MSPGEIRLSQFQLVFEDKKRFGTDEMEDREWYIGQEKYKYGNMYIMVPTR